jgi:hypothetical protein
MTNLKKKQVLINQAILKKVKTLKMSTMKRLKLRKTLQIMAKKSSQPLQKSQLTR